MLVLTRKLGQTIVIGNEIKVTVTEICGKQVKLGIEAPTRIPIYRWEIYQKILQENLKAAATAKEHVEQIAEAVKAVNK